ncbi:GNAT family N-acetyltransferase [Actinacidiphila sp. DG2A-62]|uniref:GNAT family N-acetyltransferase n=1 Tax=Actinacidiphila sp. DG2A-62 TaxID=3108821 RepID=UPI002DBFED19|nr:GNAT family N-acetyltransferase [Actinacidiphila sp. DG2A-62]MEC3993899.1 GNAT family N-acetyltransferase [Actinacidiphila sp. DG2A-62]
MAAPLPEVTLREVTDADLPVIYAQMKEPEGVRMAAFTARDPSDRAAFDAHWQRIRHDPRVTVRAVVDAQGEVLGHVGVFGPPEEREVTYWIGRRHWGRGVATAALRSLLAATPDRPLHARVVADNAASLRVLTRCGFRTVSTEHSYAPARDADVAEHLLTLPA